MLGYEKFKRMARAKMMLLLTEHQQRKYSYTYYLSTSLHSFSYKIDYFEGE
jgi:hypothetical protein